jgi:hypothetical protein
MVLFSNLDYIILKKSLITILLFLLSVKCFLNHLEILAGPVKLLRFYKIVFGNTD